MDNLKLDRKKRAAIAGSVRIRKQVRDIVDEQRSVNQQLGQVDAHSAEIKGRMGALRSSSDSSVSPDLAAGARSASRALDESVLQLALLELLCNLGRINDLKEESLRNRLQQQSLEIARLNRVSEEYSNSATRVDLTKRLVSELVD